MYVCNVRICTIKWNNFDSKGDIDNMFDYCLEIVNKIISGCYCILAIYY